LAKSVNFDGKKSKYGILGNYKSIPYAKFLFYINRLIFVD